MSRKRLPDDSDAGRRADDPAIVELLDTVREARTSLAIELSAAAGALEAGHPEVARDIVAATAEEMRRVSETAHRPGPQLVEPRRRRLNRRALLALPAIPLVGAIAMTAAAAFGGSTSASHRTAIASQLPAVHVVAPTTTTAAVAHAAATTTLQRLEHVVTHDPQAAQVLAVADDLHDQLTAMIATATNDPARLHVVRHLLMLEQHVLESVRVPGTQLALAASREIARLLERSPSSRTSSTPQTATHIRATTPRPTPTTRATPMQRPSHAQSPSSPSNPTRHAPDLMSKNTLFGRGIFNHH